MCFGGILLQCNQLTHITPHCSEPTTANCVCVRVILTPLCEGHSAVLRWLVEEPEVGKSAFSRGLMGPVGVDSVVCCAMRFEVLCRNTNVGPSAPLFSPPSSLKCWTGLQRRLRWTQRAADRLADVDEIWLVRWVTNQESTEKAGRTATWLEGDYIFWGRQRNKQEKPKLFVYSQI